MLLILFLFSFAQSAIQVEKLYSEDTDCSGTQSSWIITYPATCTPRSTCSNTNNMYGSIIECPASFSSSDLPYGWTMIQLWTSSTTCAGNPSVFVAAPSNTCSGYTVGPSYSLFCWAAEPAVRDCNTATPNCAGNGVCSTKLGSFANAGCVTGNPTFYQSTVLSYNWFCPPTTTTETTLTTQNAVTTTTGNSTSSPTTTPSSSCKVDPIFILIMISCAIYVFS